MEKENLMIKNKIVKYCYILLVAVVVFGLFLAGKEKVQEPKDKINTDNVFTYKSQENTRIINYSK